MWVSRTCQRDHNRVIFKYLYRVPGSSPGCPLPTETSDEESSPWDAVVPSAVPTPRFPPDDKAQEKAQEKAPEKTQEKIAENTSQNITLSSISSKNTLQPPISNATSAGSETSVEPSKSTGTSPATSNSSVPTKTETTVSSQATESSQSVAKPAKDEKDQKQQLKEKELEKKRLDEIESRLREMEAEKARQEQEREKQNLKRIDERLHELEEEEKRKKKEKESQKKRKENEKKTEKDKKDQEKLIKQNKEEENVKWNNFCQRLEDFNNRLEKEYGIKSTKSSTRSEKSAKAVAKVKIEQKPEKSHRIKPAQENEKEKRRRERRRRKHDEAVERRWRELCERIDQSVMTPSGSPKLFSSHSSQGGFTDVMALTPFPRKSTILQQPSIEANARHVHIVHESQMVMRRQNTRPTPCNTSPLYVNPKDNVYMLRTLSKTCIASLSDESDRNPNRSDEEEKSMRRSIPKQQPKAVKKSSKPSEQSATKSLSASQRIEMLRQYLFHPEKVDREAKAVRRRSSMSKTQRENSERD